MNHCWWYLGTSQELQLRRLEVELLDEVSFVSGDELRVLVRRKQRHLLLELGHDLLLLLREVRNRSSAGQLHDPG